MEQLKKTALAIALVWLCIISNAQRITLKEGDLSIFKDVQSINTEFNYDSIHIDKFASEADYMVKRTAEFNSKEPGKGDSWAKEWITDRKDRYEPKFNELFEKSSGITVTAAKKEALYTLLFRTTRIEPGFFATGFVHHNAETDAEVWIVETATQKKIAVITVEKAPGRSTKLFVNYDTGVRIMECYAAAGKALGKFIKNKID
jgi:hypothetical protein